MQKGDNGLPNRQVSFAVPIVNDHSVVAAAVAAAYKRGTEREGEKQEQERWNIF